MELKRYKLGDLVEVSRGTSLAGEFYATEGKLIRLTLGNFDYQRGGFKHNTSKDNIYFSGKVKDEYILNEGDIITPLTEQTAGLLGSTARIPESGKYIQSQDVALIRCKEDLLDPTFCYYLLPSASVKKQLGAAAQQTKIRHTTPDRIKEVIVDIPPLAEQKVIGMILDSITAKIDLNYSLNHYLEAMAKQLYDYWFVQFDFPDENGKPYKSSGGKMVWNEKLKREIPEGWELIPLFKGLDVQYGFPFSTNLFTETPTEIPIVRIRDIIEGSTSAFYCGDVEEKYRLNKGDIIIGMDGNFHMNYWHSDTDYLNQRCVRLRPRNDSQISALQSLFETKPYIKSKEQNAKGSTVGHLSDKDLKDMWLIKPMSNCHFNPRATFDSLLNKMIKNKEELLQLTKCRDELLPLLMNGQVSVKQLNNDLAKECIILKMFICIFVERYIVGVMKVNKTYRSLLDKSIGSMLSAIEIYNKPNFQYREETFAILSINAWELLLKAYYLRMSKYKLKALYEMQPAQNKNGTKSKRKMVVALNRCGNPKTLSLSEIMSRLKEQGKLRNNLLNNIEALIELRDNAIHFINTTPITKQVQELGFACIKNYISIIKEWRLEIDLSEYNFYLMPLAYIDERKVVDGALTAETVNYIRLIKEKLLAEDKDDGDYDIAISIDVDFKKGNSFDAIGFSYDPNGVKVALTEENLNQRFPWNRKTVVAKCVERYSDFKQNDKMNSIFKTVQSNPKLSYQRRLYPSKPAPMTYFYSNNVLQEFDKYYTRK